MQNSQNLIEMPNNEQNIIDAMKEASLALSNVANEYRIALNARMKKYPRGTQTIEQGHETVDISQNYDYFKLLAENMEQRANVKQSFLDSSR